jgi:hypothetical protein
MNSPYPGYDVLAKWDSPSYDDTTRKVLSDRLDEVPARRFLTEAQWNLLEAVNARLLPQPDRAQPIPITPWIDAMLEEENGEGFRHPDMPPMRDAWRIGMAGIDAEARAGHGGAFCELDAAAQDATLRRIAGGQADPALWPGVQPVRFFVQLLLKTSAGIYYSHPDAWSEIGFGGPASPRGYVRMGMDQRDPWEAEAAP